MPSEHRYVVRNLWNSIVDAQNAVPILKAQIDAHTTAIAANTTAINNSTASETVVPSSPLTIGFVNNQTGNTSYTTFPSDYGSCIVLNDASPIAVTLTAETTIQLPWYATFLNLGTGTATLTPASGTISYYGNIAAASMPILQGFYATVGFDGTNFWADSIPIATSLTFGAVKPDNSSITISGGVISAVGGGGAGLDFSQVFELMGG